MKLLLDENLSPALVSSLSALYPGIAHVRDIGLKSAPDPVVWQYAAQNGFTIATKDADFHHRSFLYGHPPKVIWVRLGNCSTNDIAALFTRERDRLEGFYGSPDLSFLMLT